ncbi:Transposon Ty3-G Gag-Pol polyprotein [Gossypium australe]|uniref:Transposon Ty3-G Gag-Pol polyprotein n=1 Tax=Gossypium australe TaxID=47621 RepID=A0A5B6WI38_9ROSI|nr:Transposon Ty3-G Gag-Pol polyprotein [Gossypium australe]
MDFVEGLPLSKGKSTILVIVDRLTKNAHFFSLGTPLYCCECGLALLGSSVQATWNSRVHRTIQTTCHLTIPLHCIPPSNRWANRSF